MALLFADENVRFSVIVALRDRGHDVLSALEAGRANQQIPDLDVLLHATALRRAVLTNNRRHFRKLHKNVPKHDGIVIFTDDDDIPAVADRIHEAISVNEPLAGRLVRINLPP
jgi:hypothetical protein